MRALLAQNPNARQGQSDLDEHLRLFVERGWTIEPIEGPGMRTRRHALQVTIANGPHYGGGMTIEGGATLDDGVFDIQLIEPVPLSRLVWKARALRQGRGWESVFVHAFRGSRFRLQSSRPMAVSVDGDLLTQTPIRCQLERRGLRVLRPKAS